MEKRRIEKLWAQPILDARGDPTLRVAVRLADGAAGEARLPSGDPAEYRETVELRDGDVRRCGGRGVLRAARNVNGLIAPALESAAVQSLREIDRLLEKLDGTPNGSRLGANAALGASLACARALAASAGMPLYRFLGGEMACRMPVPLVQAADGAAPGGMESREVLIAPLGAESFREGLEWCGEVVRLLPGEGFPSDEAAVEAVLAAVGKAGLGGKIQLALNAGAGRWAVDDHYRLPRQGFEMTTEELTDHWIGWAKRYPLFCLEDPLGPEDLDGWAELTLRLGGQVQLAGGDLFAASRDRLRQGLDEGAGNALVLRPHQAGSVTQCMELLDLAARRGVQTLLAHAPGGTEDPFLADLAVAANAGQIIAGPLRGAEHTAVYNRLLEIEGG